MECQRSVQYIVQMTTVTVPFCSSKRNPNHLQAKASQVAKVQLTQAWKQVLNELKRRLHSLQLQISDVSRKEAKVDYTPPQPTLKRSGPKNQPVRKFLESKSPQTNNPYQFNCSLTAGTLFISPQRPPRPSAYAHDLFQPELPASPADEMFMPPTSLRKPHRPGTHESKLFSPQLPPESPGDFIRTPPSSLRKPHRPDDVPPSSLPRPRRPGDVIRTPPSSLRKSHRSSYSKISRLQSSDLLSPHMALRKAVFSLPTPVVMKLFASDAVSPINWRQLVYAGPLKRQGLSFTVLMAAADTFISIGGMFAWSPNRI